jgi:hypothetical protein
MSPALAAYLGWLFIAAVAAMPLAVLVAMLFSERRRKTYPPDEHEDLAK